MNAEFHSNIDDQYMSHNILQENFCEPLAFFMILILKQTCFVRESIEVWDCNRMPLKSLISSGSQKDLAC